MSRKSQIDAKLDYADSEVQRLMGIMFEAKSKGANADHIIHISGGVIGTCRECFDYCAQDMSEQNIINKSTDQKLVNAINAGKKRCYFPLYEKQLTESGQPFAELKNTNPELHSFLLDLAQKIALDSPYPASLYRFGMLTEAADMNNQKKHDKLLVHTSVSDREVVADAPDMKMIINVAGLPPGITFTAAPGTKIVKASSIVFQDNQQEVGRFCMFLVKFSKIILDQIYGKFIK